MTWKESIKNKDGKAKRHSEVSNKSKYLTTLRTPILDQNIDNMPETSEELLVKHRSAFVSDMGKEMAEYWINEYLAKTSNYKNNIYYHVITTSEAEIMGSDTIGVGLGEGLYLGKDKKALVNFYGMGMREEGEKVPLQTFNGTVKLLDLTDDKNLSKFEKLAKKKYPHEKNNNEIRKLTIDKGYDGIRYYDITATGEEFVVYNNTKLTLVSTQNVK